MFEGYNGGPLPNPLARLQEEEARIAREAAEDCECLTCDGRGGKLEYDSDGDGAWAQTTTNLDLCPDCLGQNKCPGCGAQYQQINLNTFNFFYILPRPLILIFSSSNTIVRSINRPVVISLKNQFMIYRPSPTTSYFIS